MALSQTSTLDSGSGYYGAETEEQRLARIRQQQAVNAALVDQQNTVDPSSPPNYQATPPLSYPGDESGKDQGGAKTDESTGFPVSPGDSNVVTGTYGPVPGAAATASPAASPTTPNGSVPPPSPSNGLPPGTPQTASDWTNMIGQFSHLFPTYHAPNTGDIQSRIGSAVQGGTGYSLLQRILTNPDQFSEENVRQMQEAQKEQALALQKSNLMKLADRMAAKGRSGSGYQGAQERRLADQTQSNILQGSRDIGLQSAAGNWNSRLQALQQADSADQAALKRVLSEEDLSQTGVGSQQKQMALALQAALSTQGVNLNWQQLLADLAKFNANQING